MDIHAKGIVEGILYELPYLVTENDLMRVTTEWSPSWLDFHTTGDASSSALNNLTKLRTTKETQQKGKDVEVDPEPTITGEIIDLEKEGEEKDGEGIEALETQTAKGTKRGSHASVGLHKKRKGSKFVGTEDITLTKYEFTEIENMVKSATKYIWNNTEVQYKLVFEGVQLSLQELNMQASTIQESLNQAIL